MCGVARAPSCLPGQYRHRVGQAQAANVSVLGDNIRSAHAPAPTSSWDNSRPERHSTGGEQTVINDKTVAVVLPAYNSAQTLQATVDELPSLVDCRILVDDGSSDRTVALSRALGLTTFVHEANYGYGRNQMTCYREALRANAD